MFKAEFVRKINMLSKSAKQLVILADSLDRKGMYREADDIDDMLKEVGDSFEKDVLKREEEERQERERELRRRKENPTVKEQVEEKERLDNENPLFKALRQQNPNIDRLVQDVRSIGPRPKDDPVPEAVINKLSDEIGNEQLKVVSKELKEQVKQLRSGIDNLNDFLEELVLVGKLDEEKASEVWNIIASPLNEVEGIIIRL